MHIPDGYLSPSTCAAAAAAAGPAWMIAARRLKNRLHERQAPLLAAGAAFAFAIMMLNVPVPDGTTAHAVGGTLVAIVLGPEAAILAITVALVIQALFFGDGGVLALGANCLNMAVILPLSGYVVYRALDFSNHSTGTRPRPWAAACGAYFGINMAALAAALELGLQPLLFHTRAGSPLYCPYHLSQTIPAMALAHLTVAGGVEAAVTGMVVAYLARTAPETVEGPGTSQAWAWRGLALLLMLAPLGLLAPGSAFGEYSAEELKKVFGFVPSGLGHWNNFWGHALLPDYNLPGADSSGLWRQAMGYWLAGAMGISLILLLTWLLAKMLARGQSSNGAVDLMADEVDDRGQTSNVKHQRVNGAMGQWVNSGSTHPRTGDSPQHWGVGGASPPLLDSPQNWGVGGPVPQSEAPSWLLQPEVGSLPCQRNGRRMRVPFVEKTLSDAAEFVQQTLFAEALARSPGLLQRLDPRVKLVTLGLTLVIAGLLHHLWLLLGLFVLSLAAAALSQAPPGIFLRRLSILPLFTAIAALPALFNWITPGAPLLVLARWPHPLTLGPFSAPSTLSITQQGLLGVLVLVSRVAVSISLVALLTLTTRWAELLKALRTFFAPGLFVFVLSMVYRYLFLFLQTASDLFIARKSRTLGKECGSDGRRFVAASAAFLFAKSQALSEEVHTAMVSRGYRGEPLVLEEWRPGLLDALWTGVCLLLLCLFWGGDQLLG